MPPTIRTSCDWRHETSQRLPEFQTIIAELRVDGPLTLWIELDKAFEELCQGENPPLDLLRRIWRYCEWCLIHGSNPMRIAAAIGFCERLLDTPERARLLPKIMEKRDFTALKCALLFHNEEESYERWLRELWPGP